MHNREVVANQQPDLDDRQRCEHHQREDERELHRRLAGLSTCSRPRADSPVAQPRHGTIFPTTAVEELARPRGCFVAHVISSVAIAAAPEDHERVLGGGLARGRPQPLDRITCGLPCASLQAARLLRCCAGRPISAGTTVSRPNAGSTRKTRGKSRRTGTRRAWASARRRNVDAAPRRRVERGGPPVGAPLRSATASTSARSRAPVRVATERGRATSANDAPSRHRLLHGRERSGHGAGTPPRRSCRRRGAGVPRARRHRQDVERAAASTAPGHACGLAARTGPGPLTTRRRCPSVTDAGPRTRDASQPRARVGGVCPVQRARHVRGAAGPAPQGGRHATPHEAPSGTQRAHGSLRTIAPHPQRTQPHRGPAPGRGRFARTPVVTRIGRGTRVDCRREQHVEHRRAPDDDRGHPCLRRQCGGLGTCTDLIPQRPGESIERAGGSPAGGRGDRECTSDGADRLRRRSSAHQLERGRRASPELDPLEHPPDVGLHRDRRARRLPRSRCATVCPLRSRAATSSTKPGGAATNARCARPTRQHEGDRPGDGTAHHNGRSEQRADRRREQTATTATAVSPIRRRVLGASPMRRVASARASGTRTTPAKRAPRRCRWAAQLTSAGAAPRRPCQHGHGGSRGQPGDGHAQHANHSGIEGWGVGAAGRHGPAAPPRSSVRRPASNRGTTATAVGSRRTSPIVLDAARAVAAHDVDDESTASAICRWAASAGIPTSGHEHERSEPVDHGVDAVRVHGGERAVVTGVERLEEVERLGAAHLPDDDAVGSHPQRGADERPHRYAARALGVGRPSLEPHTCGNGSCSSAVSSMVTTRSPTGNEPAERVAQRRLARRRAARHDDVGAVRHRPPRGTRPGRPTTPNASEVDPPATKRRIVTQGPSTASGGITACDPRPVGQPGVDDGRRAVEAQTQRSDDPLDQPQVASTSRAIGTGCTRP